MQRDFHHPREGSNRDMLARSGDARLANGYEEFRIFWHRKAFAIDKLVLEKHDRVRIADRRLQQALMVRPGERGDHLETRAMRIPARIALGMLCGDARGDAVWPAEDDRAAHLAARHVAGLRGRVDDLIHRLHGEIEGHELDDWAEPGKACADPEPGKPLLGNRGIDHPPRSEFLKQALADLVGTLILSDLLAEQKNRIVA